jgi:multiple sugar transport system substrate-binding protein
MTRDTFRIAVRRFPPFECAIAKQWGEFESVARTGLNLEAVPFDLHPLHETLFEFGGAADGSWDVAFLVTDWMAEAAETHAFANLEAYLAADPPEDYPQGWTESLLRFQQIDRRVLGLPYHDGPECLIYRTDLFGQETAPPRTWEEFHRLSQRFHRPEQGIYGSVFAGYPDGHNAVYDFCLQLWSRGGWLFQLGSDSAVEGLRFYRNILRDQTAVHPGSMEFDSVKSGYAFAAGQVAMMVNWFGFAAMAQTAADSKVRGKVSVAPAPGGVSLNVYWVLAMCAGSPHTEVAWKFLRHCASRSMDKALTLEGAIGCRRSTWVDMDVMRAIPFYPVMEDLHRDARELPRLPNWSRIAAVLDHMMQLAIRTDRAERSLLLEAQDRIARLNR